MGSHMGNTEVAGLLRTKKKTMSLKLALVCLTHFAYTLAAPLEEKAEERIIGYGLTNTGYTVLAGMLVAVLGLTFVSQSGNAPFRRSQTLQERRQQFIEHCQIHPELPECVQKIQKRRQRKYRQRRHQ